MSNRRKRASSDWGPGSDNKSQEVEEEEEEEGEETTSKVTSGAGGSSRTLVKRRRRKEDVVDMTSAVGLWATSLKGPHLDLMVSLKQLAEVRLMNTGEESLSCCLTAASLRTIGIILEELIKDRMSVECPPTEPGLHKEHGDAKTPEGGEESSVQAGGEE